jgi:Domain of unknown function (DUF4440)
MALSISPRLQAAALLLAVTGCVGGGNPANLVPGTSGLTSAIPGGDGRSAALYQAEFNADLIQGVDSLMLRYADVWQRHKERAIEGLYAENATLVAPDGHLISGGERLRAYARTLMPRIAAEDSWRDDFTGSGEMALSYGRYRIDSVEPGMDHHGVQLTIAKRDGLVWKIRSKFYLSFEASGAPLPEALCFDDPPHVTSEAIRADFGRRALRGQDERAEWMVSSYFAVNGILGQLRHSWDRDDAGTISAMLAPGAIVRLPWDIPAVDPTNATYSLERLLPAAGDLHMTILDFDRSERLLFALGAYRLRTGRQDVEGYYMIVIQQTDDGPLIRALVFSGAGANPASSSEGVPRP